jgi:hypothetical protein
VVNLGGAGVRSGAAGVKGEEHYADEVELVRGEGREQEVEDGGQVVAELADEPPELLDVDAEGGCVARAGAEVREDPLERDPEVWRSASVSPAATASVSGVRPLSTAK